MSIDMMTPRQVERQLKALANPARRCMVELLKRKGCCSAETVGVRDPGMCICDLQAQLSLTQPTVTHHVRVLRQAGLIHTRKMGRWVYCRRNEPALDRLGAWLKKL